MAERLTIDKAIAHAREVARENKYRAEHKSFHRNDKDEISACLQCVEEHEQLAGWLKDLQHYKDLEEQGRLIELPCKIGDTVWELCKCDDNKYRIFPMTVVDINAYGRPKPKRVKHENQPIYNIYAESDYTYLFASFYDIGRIIFLTKAEAEAALKEEDK